MENLPERLASKIEPEPMSGCWLWTAGLSGGYGRVSWNGKSSRLAHRVVYELLVGPIPSGLVIDHLCGNTACVSPWHMEPVSHSVNIARTTGMKKPGSGRINRSKTECPQGHPYDETNTILTARADRECRTCRKARDRRWRVSRREAAS